MALSPASLEAFLAAQGHGAFHTVDHGDHVDYVISVAKPASTEAPQPAREPSPGAPAWQGACRRWWCIFTARNTDSEGIWGAVTAGHWFVLKERACPTRWRAFSSLARARAGWTGEPGLHNLPTPRVRQVTD